MNSLKRFFSSKIFLVTSLSGVSTLVRVVTSLISAKLIAIYSGTMGMALLGQLTNISSIFLNLSTGFSSTGVVQLLAKGKNNEQSQTAIIIALFQLTLCCSIITGFLLIIGNSFIGNYIFEVSTYNSIILIFGITIILYSLNAQFLAILNGLQEYTLLVKVNIITSLMSLVFNLGMIINFHTYGVLLSYVTTQSIAFFYTFFVLHKNKILKITISDLTLNIYWNEIKQLSKLSLMSLVSSTAVPITQILVRAAITRKLTIEQTGLWEATNRISSIYLMLITSSLAIYFLPKIASLTSKIEIRNEVKKTIMFILPILLFSTTIIYFTRNMIVVILFTPEFNIQELISVQLIGDFFKMLAWILGYLMIGRGLIKSYIFSEILLNSLYYFLVLIGLDFFGLIGCIYAYVLTYTISILVYTFFSRNFLFLKMNIEDVK